LGLYYLVEAKGADQDTKRGLALLHKAARGGSSWAQNKLGIVYRDGVGGIKKDFKESIKWFTLSAESGFASAQNHLGLSIENGLGITRNADKAIEWYRKASNNGYLMATFNLVRMYSQGKGLPKSGKEIDLWLRSADQKGDRVAAYILWQMYNTGALGIIKDNQEALKWLRKAAIEREFIWAQGDLGRQYQKGAVLGQNDEEALKWFRKAAEKGCQRSQYNLARMYAVTKSDYIHSAAWYLLALTNGYEKARSSLSGLKLLVLNEEKLSKAASLAKQMAKENPRLILSPSVKRASLELMGGLGGKPKKSP